MKFKVGDKVRIVIDDPELHDYCHFLNQIKYGTIYKKDNNGLVCVRWKLTDGVCVRWKLTDGSVRPWWLDPRCLGLYDGENFQQERFEFHKKRVESRHLGV